MIEEYFWQGRNEDAEEVLRGFHKKLMSQNDVTSIREKYETSYIFPNAIMILPNNLHNLLAKLNKALFGYNPIRITYAKSSKIDDVMKKIEGILERSLRINI